MTSSSHSRCKPLVRSFLFSLFSALVASCTGGLQGTDVDDEDVSELLLHQRSLLGRQKFLSACGLGDTFAPGEMDADELSFLNDFITDEDLRLLDDGDVASRCEDLVTRIRAFDLDQLELPSHYSNSCDPSCVIKQETGPGNVTTNLRFAAVGDPGDRNSRARQEVASQVKSICSQSVDGRACDFVVLLGDNLYDSGIRKGKKGEQDKRALADIVRSYGDRPVFLILGNHDYKKIIPTLSRAQRELAWIGNSEGVHGNAHYYDFRSGPVHLWGIDTNYLVRRPSAAEEMKDHPWVNGIGSGDSMWKIAFGHHSYLSNGPHGNAGGFLDAEYFKLWPGKEFKRFMEAHVLNDVDLYISGHDHNLQFFPRWREGSEPSAALAVSGSGAKCTSRRKAPENPGSTGVAAGIELYDEGFVVVAASPAQLSIRFYDSEGDEVGRAARSGQKESWDVEGMVNTEDKCGLD